MTNKYYIYVSMNYDDLMAFIKEYKTFLVVLFGAIITVFGALWDNKDKLKDKQEALDNEVRRNDQYVNIIKKSDEMLNKQQSLIDANAKIIDLQSKLEDANKSVIDLQNSTLDFMTGRGSFCFFRAIPDYSKFPPDSAALFVVGMGKNPLRSIVVAIDDVSYAYGNREHGAMLPLGLGKPQVHHINYLKPKNKIVESKDWDNSEINRQDHELGQELGIKIPFSKTHGAILGISIDTEFDSWFESYHLVPRSDDSGLAESIILYHNNKVIFRRRDKDFPANL